ncbi:MAG: chromosome segregation protein SMC [Clostridia bacterium]|nr:chromosome segregation protein SMC [Clostridia bacterium]
MELKEIHLSGFKSFADKTVIRFDEGVTCIVGPNGCGKSNVADAVRWVLGEQSAKALRGSNMQDVIFGGTVERKQGTYCEVTLVFDNTKRIFDIELDEVAMTRRLYRSGESKYLLNGQPSKWKEFIRLFHGVGLGKEGYSIIGQGKVEQIMNARPADRRLIFEEATGLMVNKARKIEIERKIDDANENLYIYRQRIDEAERRLGPLSRQAEAAKQYREYAENLKDQEVNMYIYRTENAENETSKYRQEVMQISDKIIDLNSEIERINRLLEEGRAKIAAADDEIAELHDSHVALSVGNERKDGELKLVREKISALRSQIEAATVFLEGGKTRVAEIGDELALGERSKKTDLARLSQIDGETDVLRSAIAALDSKIAVFERLSDEQRSAQLSSAEDLSELKKNQGALASQLAATKDRILEVEAALSKNGARKEALESELAAVRKDLQRLMQLVGGGATELEEQVEEARELQMNINNFNQELFNANAQLASLKENLEMYISLKNRFEGYKDSVRRLLLVAKTNPDVGKRICGTVSDILKTEQKYETAIETALGGAMQNIVVPTMDDGRWLIEYLSRTGAGKATFFPVESMKPRPDTREIQRALSERGVVGLATQLVKYDDYYYNVVSNLLGNTLICDNIGNATTIAKKYGSMFKIVTLDGNQTLTSGAMSGGSQDRGRSSFLSHERKIQECRENIAKKQRQIEKIEAAIRASERAKQEADEAVETLRARYQEANTEIASLRQRENSLAQSIADLAADTEVYASALKDFKEKLALLETEEASSSQNEEALHALRQSAEDLLHSQRDQCEQFKAERAEKSAKLHDLEVEYASLNEKLRKYEEDAQRLNTEKEELLRRIVETSKEKLQAEQTLEALEAEAQEKELKEEEKAAVQAIVERLAQINKEKEEINARQTELEEKKALAQEQLTKLMDKRHKNEMEISLVRNRLEGLRDRVMEEYGLDYEGCLPFRKENFSVSEANNVIAALKRKITSLGAVNPNAVEEYADEKAHYDEMIAQRDDLQKAIEDLDKILQDIRGEMLRIFNEGFEQINENFKTTFKELFGGGKAELQLDYTLDEDPLNAGVEIIACPPGKKLTKISLLSGGERALTAIAILFAILKSHPMPFCILDEIEAALDDANVDRFASYLKNFSQDTQFIVITHRKPTMNQADTLFGVTMQEKGVSKIVSVKLAEVESKLGAGTVE